MDIFITGPLSAVSVGSEASHQTITEFIGGGGGGWGGRIKINFVTKWRALFNWGVGGSHKDVLVTTIDPVLH